MGPEEEFEKFDKNGSWSMVYQKLRNEASIKHDFSLKDSKTAEFRSRNRYRDVSPYDHSRVKLERDGVDYINASLVTATDADRSYILTQGPLPSTAGHFWLMIWEQNSKAVLMLNRVIEKGQIKCYQYFPTSAEEGGDDVMEFDDVDLKVSFIDEVDASYFTIRTLLIEDLRSGQSRQVLQFHYTTWPDFGVPQSPGAFLNFLMAVRQSGALDPDVGPPVIHCSAGIGRSGTFCLVDTCLVLLERSRDPNSIDIRSVLMDMRQFRMGLIQTPDQLRFSYLSIIEGTKRVLSVSPDSGIGDSSEGGDSELPPSPLSIVNNMQGHDPTLYTSPFTNEDDDIPDAPPPLPPRGKKVVLEEDPRDNPNYTKDTNDVKLGNDAENETERKRKEGMEIRRRNREERIKNTAEKIQTMKRKQQESEKWKARRATLRPFVIGFSISLLVGGYIFYRYYST